jgi:hypothetical protein
MIIRVFRARVQPGMANTFRGRIYALCAVPKGSLSEKLLAKLMHYEDFSYLPTSLYHTKPAH